MPLSQCQENGAGVAKITGLAVRGEDGRMRRANSSDSVMQ